MHLRAELEGESVPSASGNIKAPQSLSGTRTFLREQAIPGMVIGSSCDVETWNKCERLEVIDPSYGAVVYELPQGNKEFVDGAVQSAASTFNRGDWSDLTPRERGRVLARLAERIRGSEKERLALLETIDIGKPLRVSRVDVDVCAGYFEYYAGLADKILGSTQRLQSDGVGLVFREPIGVSAQIIPFNFPLQQIGRGVAPALAAGCSVVIKPSPEASLTASVIARLAIEAGVPEGVVNVVTGGSDVGEALVSHPLINQVTFTGSVNGGIAVTRNAADNVVPTLLELGGKSASVVMNDYGPETAAGVGRMAFYNTGQNCGAGTRLLLQQDIAESFLTELVDWTNKITIGPGQEDEYLGPLISSKQLEKVERYLEQAKEEGGTFLTGGVEADLVKRTGGYYVQPAIITGLPRDSSLFQEEIFGPVLCVDTFDTLDEAIDLANATDYGLAAYIWTESIRDAMRFAKRVHSGGVSINGGAGTGIELPSGGVKKSGWGREKGPSALENYTYIKSVTLKH